MRDRGAREQLERGVVVDLLAAQHAAVAVRGVLAEADVGEQEQLGEARPQRTERLLDDPVGDPGTRAVVVLLLGDAEQDHGLDAGAEQLLALAHDPSTVSRDIGGSASLRSASGATKSGITRSSSESVVSRTRSRSAPVRRRRRSRVAGNVLIVKGYGIDGHWRSQRAAAAVDAAGCVGSRTGSISTGIGRAARPRLERDPLGEELPHRLADGEDRQSDQRADQPVDVRAREQPEDHEQRVEPQRAPHHLRHDDVTLDLVDAEEEQHDPDHRERMHDERVDHRRDRAEPRAEIGQHLGQRHPGAEEKRVGVGAGQKPGDAEDP